MGLATRVVPTLLIRGDQLVKGEKFNAWRSVGHPAAAMRTHQLRGVDEVIVLDIGATPEEREPNFKLIERLVDGCFSPVTVGGGVRSVDHVRELLRIGADKVAICTGAVEVPRLVRECADKFGNQAIVVAIEHAGPFACSRQKCQHPTLWTAVNFARVFAKAGAGEILLTSILQEGTQTGYDLPTIAAVSAAVTVPVIAHGGCGRYEDMYFAVRAGASAVAAGAFFQFTDATPKKASQFLHERGIEARV